MSPKGEIGLSKREKALFGGANFVPSSGEWASDLAAVDDDESDGRVEGEEADEVCNFAVAVGESGAFEGDFDDALGDGVNGEELGDGLDPQWHGVVWPDVAAEGEEDECGAQDELECRVARAAERCQGGSEGEVAGDHDQDEFHDFDGGVAAVPGEERAEVDVDECRSETDEEGVEQVAPEVIDEPEIFLGE